MLVRRKEIMPPEVGETSIFEGLEEFYSRGHSVSAMVPVVKFRLSPRAEQAVSAVI